MIEMNAFNDVSVLIIGDVMIDRYFFGSIHRRSPEADVPIVDIHRVEDRLGGAANVAVNVAQLGAKSLLFSVVGEDEEAKKLHELCQRNKLSSIGLISSSSRKTTVKNRVYSDQNYAFRFDEEITQDISEDAQQKLIDEIEKAIELYRPSVAILQDYNKGVFSEDSIGRILNLLKQHQIPTAVDPKQKNFYAYKGVDLFKPNLKEVVEAACIDVNPADKDQVHAMLADVQRELNVKKLIVTLSEYGIVGIDEHQKIYVSPAQASEVVDVSGAGDTVISIASLMLAKAYSMADILAYCNVGAGQVIRRLGVSAASIDDIRNVK